MGGIITSLLRLLIEKELLILEEGSHVDVLSHELVQNLQEHEHPISLGEWLGSNILRSVHVVELFATDKELADLVYEIR